jgi:aspartyl-tRNA(Asn)/glutamyl-tRNA(Gln) amidotransferase subunit B
MDGQLLGKYKLVLGLEIHLHLKTANKMFCRDDADIYGKEPNTHTCPVCLGLPGALPIPNFEAIRKTQLLGLALNCSLNRNSRFDRKHYFYPDLAKGYQISQYKQPLCGEGYVILDSGKKMLIERIHLEEDTAKSFHEGGNTLIDFNKAGMPLVEIVTMPVFTDVDDAVEFCRKIQDVVRYLGIGDVDMEKGQMRLEANISLRTEEMEKLEELPAYKVEIKNINSFRFMERAVKAEIVRQRALLESGATPVQENRGFDEDKNLTVSQREKEEAHDYRYFPEPDIPPMVFDDAHLHRLAEELPELPDARKERLMNELGLSGNVASFLSSGANIAIYEKFSELIKAEIDAKKAGNALMNKKEYWEMDVQDLAQKIKESGDKVTDTSVISAAVKDVVAKNPDAVAKIKEGKTSTIEFLIGMVMRETKGKADSAVVRKLLEEEIF